MRAAAPLDIKRNLPIIPPLAFSLVLLGFYFFYGLSSDYLLPVLLLGSVFLMSALSMMGKIDRYWVAIISIMLSYEALQGAVGTLVSRAGVVSLYSLDYSLWGFNVTGWIQTHLASPGLTFVTSVLYSLHFPLIVVTCVVVWYMKRPLLGKYVTAMALTSYAALVTFLLMPTAPPWYMGVAVNLYHAAASSLPQGFLSFVSLVEVDQFAAFPSLHAAYAIIFSYFMIKVDRRLALVSIPITVGILFSTLYLGQHYLIDLIGGAVYALIPCLIAERFQLRLPRSVQAPATTETKA